MTKHYVGDTGTVIVVDCGEVITTSTLKKLLVRKPDSTSVEWVATLEGTTQLKYTVIEGDFNCAGTYEVQAYIEMPGWKGLGDMDMFTVNKEFT